MRKVTYGEAIKLGLKDSLKSDSSTVLLGQDIRHDAYGFTGGFLEEFGKSRVVDVPLSEAAVVGTAIGAAMCGVRVIVDLTVGNFLYVAMDQIASIAAKNSYMYNGQYQLPLTILYSTFQQTGSAAQHSDRPHPMLMGIPGLKVVLPARAQEAYSAMRSAVCDNNPVVVGTDRSIFYSEQEIDTGLEVHLGRSNIVKQGQDVTIIGISSALHIALQIDEELQNEGISAEIIDPVTLVPLDFATIEESVRKTGRAVIVDTAHKTCSAASEISARLAEGAFEHLKTPIRRLGYEDVPIPFARCLEDQIMPTKEKLLIAVREMFEK